MSCPDEDDVLASLYGELAPERAAEVASHTGTCAACARRAAFARSIRERIAGLPEPSPSPGFEARMLARMAAAMDEARRQARPVPPPALPARPRPLPRRGSLAGFLAGLAASLVLVAGYHAARRAWVDPQGPRDLPIAMARPAVDTRLRLATAEALAHEHESAVSAGPGPSREEAGRSIAVDPPAGFRLAAIRDVTSLATSPGADAAVQYTFVGPGAMDFSLS